MITSLTESCGGNLIWHLMFNKQKQTREVPQRSNSLKVTDTFVQDNNTKALFNVTEKRISFTIEFGRKARTKLTWDLFNKSR